MKRSKNLNEKCKNFVQHYYYNKDLKTFMHTNCGHCKKFKTNCECCSDFVHCSKGVEEIELSIHHKLSKALNVLNNIIKLFEEENY